MVRKLIYDDCRAIWRNWLAILQPALFVWLIGLLIFASNLPLISGAGQYMAVIGTVVAFASLPVILIVHYWKNLYSEHGYLTFTLPTKGRNLYASKAVSAFIFMMLDWLVLALLISGFTVAVDVQQRLKPLTGLRSALAMFGEYEHKGIVILLVLGAMLLYMITAFTQFSFIITKSNEARFHSLGKGAPVLFYILTYLLQQAASLIGMVFIPIGVRFKILSDDVSIPDGLVFESSLSTFRDVIRTGGEIEHFVLGLGFILMLLLLSLIYAWFSIRSIEKHTSLR